MASEVRAFQVLVPAGTTAAAPQVTSLTMPPRIVSEVRVRVPPGPSGSVGFALGSAGQRVIPWNAGAWIVADGETFTWALSGQISSGAWQLQAYNTGRWDHTLYLVFQLSPVGQGNAITLGPPLDLGA